MQTDAWDELFTTAASRQPQQTQGRRGRSAEVDTQGRKHWTYYYLTEVGIGDQVLYLWLTEEERAEVEAGG